MNSYNPLYLLPSKFRRYVYAAFALAVVVTGALQAAGVDVHKAPAVLAYLGGALALQAAANVATVREGEDIKLLQSR